MATGEKLINMYNKKVTSGTQLRENWIEYFEQLIEDNLAALYPASGFFAAPTLSYPGAGLFQISNYAGLQSSGVEPVRRYDYAGGDSIAFEDANGTDYWVQSWLALCPEFAAAGIEGSPEFGTYRYSHLEEKVGLLDEPDSVSDLGPGVRMIIDGVLTAGEGSAFDQSGREVTVMLWPDPLSLDPAVAFQALTVQWSGTQNYVDVPDYLGDSAIRAAGEYRVFVPVCTVSDAAPTGDGNWTAKITSNAPGAPTFDYTGQVILGFSPSTISSAFQREHVLTGGADDGLHKNVNALNYGNRSTAEGGSAGIKLDFTAVDASDYGGQQIQRDHVGDIRWALDSYGRIWQVGDDANLTGTDWPFQFSQDFGYSGEGMNALARLQILGEDDDYIQSENSVVRYIGGGSYPEGMTATTKTGGAIDISGVPDMTADAILPVISDFCFLVEVTDCADSARDGWYIADVADADTLDVWELDGSSTGWSGDQAAEVTFYIVRRQILAKEDGDTSEMLHLLASPNSSIMCQGEFVGDNPLDAGTNQFLGWGFAYYDLNRERLIFEARASGAVTGMSFASTDEVVADPVSGATGPDERASGLKAAGYASDEGDLLLFTGNDSSGAVYLGQPHEGVSWSWLTFDDLFMMLTSVDNYSMKDLLPWTANLNLGNVVKPWDVFAHDMRVDGDVIGDLIPNISGHDLGDATYRWDVFLDALDISGSITGNLVPVATGQDLGDASHRWDAFVETLSIYSTIAGNLTPSVDSDGSTGYDIGGTSARWRALYAWDGRFYDELRADGDCIFGDSSTPTTGSLRGDWSFGYNSNDDFTWVAKKHTPEVDNTIELGRHYTGNGSDPLRLLHHVAAYEYWVAESMHQAADYDKTSFAAGAVTGGKEVVHALSPQDGECDTTSDWTLVSTYWTAPENSSADDLFFPVDVLHGSIATGVEYRVYQDVINGLVVHFGYWSGAWDTDWSFTTLESNSINIGTGNHGADTSMDNYYIDLSDPGRRYGFLIEAATGAGQTVQLKYLALKVKVDQAEIER